MEAEKVMQNAEKSKEIRKAILMVIFVTIFTSIGQLLFKISADKLALDFYLLITNYAMIAGFVLYFTGAIILILALKKGELSVLYPIIALSFIWVSLLSAYFLGEPMSIQKWVGIIGIMAGVSAIGMGSK